MGTQLVLLMSFQHRFAARSLLPALLLLLSWALLTSASAAPPAANPPPSGRVVVTGSVALSNLISLWADDFSNQNPTISITVANPGSAVGLDALINGSADVVLSSISISQQQADDFANRFGYAPTLIPVAMDGVAVYVNSLNPLRQITLTQLDAIYSATLRCGAHQPLRRWAKLGVKGELGSHPIAALGLNTDTGANQLFKQIALCDGDFRTDFQALAGPGAVESGLIENPAAIGFSSSALRSASIHALAIIQRAGETAVSPSVAAIQNGRYPLARTFSVIINIPPGQKVAPAVQAFLDYARSSAGQAVAAKGGYVPLPSH
jgi:phosphate transport system substrate-binding protein